MRSAKPVNHLKKTATEIFAKATFTLQKWSSNARELELTEATDSEVGILALKRSQETNQALVAFWDCNGIRKMIK